MKFRRTLQLLSSLAIIAAMVLAAAPTLTTVSAQSGGNWWEVVPEEENPSSSYDSILYSEIAPKLREIEVNSNRVSVEVIGQSAGGRNLFLATVTAPEARGSLGRFKAIRNAMLRDPERAQEMIAANPDFKVPVFINGSIHGNEYPGTDAAIRLIETLAYDDSPEVMAILDKFILLFNVVQNPDGRVLGTRQNANGFDINRDFITQSQPETRATIDLLTEWNPMITLDLHGFVNPMLIEPCTPPHNPNYEYDLYIKWALPQAEAMEAELLAQTGFPAQIPFRDFDLGWDDWPPTYTPMFAMYHGSYGHTLETPYRDERGVDAHYWAVWGALEFAAANQEAMIHDQIEMFRRGFLDLPQMLIPDEILDQTAFDQFNELTVQEFPHAYVIPPDAPAQYSDHQVARLVDFLLVNDVQVEQASQDFTADGVRYPRGSYVVWMDQPKRGLANTILESGPDLSDIPGLFFYSPPSVWSNPLLWGVRRAVVEGEFRVNTVPVNKPDAPKGSLSGRRGAAYAYQPDRLEAFQATNALLGAGEMVFRAPAAFSDRGTTYPAGTLIVSTHLGNRLANQHGLDLTALSAVPAGAVALELPEIAIYADEGLGHALRTLGFPFTALSRTDMRAGLMDDRYEVFINRSSSWGNIRVPGQEAFATFAAAGGDYIGISDLGIGFGLAGGMLTGDFDVNEGNAIVNVDFTPGDELSAGYMAEDYGFVYFPAWFTTLGAGVEVSASFDASTVLVSGFWPGWQTSRAEGMPVAVHYRQGDNYTAMFGLDLTFRGHPENSFRLLGNAIYSAQD